jgi:hypothetical protein
MDIWISNYSKHSSVLAIGILRVQIKSKEKTVSISLIRKKKKKRALLAPNEPACPSKKKTNKKTNKN